MNLMVKQKNKFVVSCAQSVNGSNIASETIRWQTGVSNVMKLWFFVFFCGLLCVFVQNGTKWSFLVVRSTNLREPLILVPMEGSQSSHGRVWFDTSSQKGGLYRTMTEADSTMTRSKPEQNLVEIEGKW